LRDKSRRSTLLGVTDVVWHVGDVVRKLRLQKQLTQKQLAKRAGLHHNTIVRLEDGDEGVQGRTLKQVADALDISLPALWSLVPEREPQRGDKTSSPTSGAHFRYDDP
jgi:transcriptional regulator with XRE-family HTH domain